MCRRRRSRIQDTLARVTAYFAAQGAAAVNAKNLAIGWIGQMLQNQATILSYIDVFRDLAIATALMVPIALLLRPVDRGAAQPAAH